MVTENQASEAAPQAGNLRIGSCIIYEDHRFLVVDKPANLLVHPTFPGGPNTLWDELRKFLAYEIVNGGQISFVNRLDRETSGLILIAKSTETARALSHLISQHRIRKIYIAIVFGWPESDAFVVNQPLLRQGTVRPSKIWLKQTVHPDVLPGSHRVSRPAPLIARRETVRFTCRRTQNRPYPPDPRPSCSRRPSHCWRQNLRSR
jgi:23S rRNA-/tRNA-specific pseudouridylate synthase